MYCLPLVLPCPLVQHSSYNQKVITKLAVSQVVTHQGMGKCWWLQRKERTSLKTCMKMLSWVYFVLLWKVVLFLFVFLLVVCPFFFLCFVLFLASMELLKWSAKSLALNQLNWIPLCTKKMNLLSSSPCLLGIPHCCRLREGHGVAVRMNGQAVGVQTV